MAFSRPADLKQAGDRAAETVDVMGKTITGKVIYVHPERRFYTVEFQCPYGTYRECFTDMKYEK